MFSTLPALNIIKNGVVLILGSFSLDNGHGNENVTFTMNSRFSNFVVFIPIRWKCHMSANFPGVEFLGTTLICRRLFTYSG